MSLNVWGDDWDLSNISSAESLSPYILFHEVTVITWKRLKIKCTCHPGLFFLFHWPWKQLKILAGLDLLPNPRARSCVTDQICVDIFIAARCLFFVIYAAFDSVMDAQVKYPTWLPCWGLWNWLEHWGSVYSGPDFWWLSRITKASLIHSQWLAVLQVSTRCCRQPTAPLHVVQQRCNIHFGVKSWN